MSLNNTTSLKRKILKIVNRIWLSTGALAVCFALVITNCSGVDVNGDISIDQIATKNAQTDDRFNAARALWIAESGEDGDPYSAGFAAYQIATVTRDPKWSNEAISRLGDAQKLMPKFALATAWRGSAHALAARDFPLQGAWQLVPGPGFIRIYHVERAKWMMNKAVKQAPNDPAVRLIRAATLAKMPAFFVDATVVENDFALMAQWHEAPSMNEDFSTVLKSAKWRADFNKAYADYLATNDAPATVSDTAAK